MVTVTEEQYDEFLDQAYGDVKICELSYSTSQALKSVDPTAYRIGMGDYEDSLNEDEEYDND